MELLARETVSNVLSRLSVKDLMRCKCVCKLWFDLITDPHFISNHYLFYNTLEAQQQEHLLLIRKPDYQLRSVETEMSILSWNRNEPNGLVSSYVLNPPRDRYGRWSHIMGPCNGIYFLNGLPNIIMNPCLSHYITLPPRPLFWETLKTGFDSCHYLRFGFDPKTNDYKVVVIRIVYGSIPGTEIIKWTVDLYSLNSNSWKILEDNLNPFPFARLSHRSQVFTYVNNCCYWWGCLHKSNKEQSDDVECAVLSFDMVGELFRMIKMPKFPIITPSTTLRNHQNLIHLIVVSQRNITPFSEFATIGIIDCYNVGQGAAECFCFDVWMMKDYWDEGSWIKLYSVCPMPFINRRLIGYCGSNQYLWIQASERNDRLVLSGLDPEENTRDLLVCRDFEVVETVRYMESLVSLKMGIRF